MDSDFLELACCALVGLSAGAAVYGLARVSPEASPHLGQRGAARSKALASSALFAAFEPLLRKVAGLVACVELPRQTVRQEERLRWAGYWLGLTPYEYRALCLLSGLSLGTVAAGLLLASGARLGLTAPATVFGLLLPRIRLEEIIRQRVKEVTRALPHTIEVAALCMNAGLDFVGALRPLAQGPAGRRDTLTEEIELILAELELGHTRREALEAFAARVPAPAVRDFVNAVVQSDQKGNPLSRVLKVQGRMLNMRRSVAAEEAAARAGVLMIAPLMLLVACILLLLMGPFLVSGVGF